MSSPQLPADGPEREIFLVALARMSDQCQPPELIAECPFSVEIPGGGRGCGAECEDILGEVAPGRRPGEVTLGALGFSARQRASLPVPPVPVGRAFDAAETYYRESEVPDLARWSPVGLLVGFRRVAETHPFERSADQQQRATDCRAELSRRGFDMDAIAQGPLGRCVAGAIITDVLYRTLRRPEGEHDETETDSRLGLRDAMYEAKRQDGDLPELPAEVVVDGVDAEELPKLIFTVIGEFAEGVIAWCQSAEAERLLNWDVTDLDDLMDQNDARDDKTATWLFDRFTNTYLSEWNPASLKLEWNYRKTGQSPVSDEEMSVRRIDPLELAERVADLAADRNDEQRVRDVHLTNHAVAMLRADRRDAAAALFDAARRSDWDDAQLHNNYGFCLLPDDPERALEALNLAFQRGFRLAVNWGNRALCLQKLGRSAAALEVLEESFEIWSDLETARSFLWSIEESESPKLIHECPRCYLVRLGASIADSAGDETASALWGRRSANLVHRAD